MNTAAYMHVNVWIVWKYIRRVNGSERDIVREIECVRTTRQEADDRAKSLSSPNNNVWWSVGSVAYDLPIPLTMAGAAPPDSGSPAEVQ